MTLLADPPRIDHSSPEALIKEAHQLRRRRWQLGGLAVVLALIAGSLTYLATSRMDGTKRAPGTTAEAPASATAGQGMITSVVVTATTNSITSHGTVANGTGVIIATTLGDRPVKRIVEDFSFGGSLPNSNTRAIYLKGRATARIGDEQFSVGGRIVQYNRLTYSPARVCTTTCVTTHAQWLVWPAPKNQSVWRVPGGYDPEAILNGLRTVAKGELVKAGDARVAGVLTTKYRESVDPMKWSGADKELGALLTMMSVPKSGSISIWLDHQGRLRQIQTSHSGWQGPGPAGRVPTAVVNTWTFANFNRPIATKPPPADDVFVIRNAKRVSISNPSDSTSKGR